MGTKSAAAIIFAVLIARFVAKVIAAVVGELFASLGVIVDMLRLYARANRGDVLAERRARIAVARSLRLLVFDVGTVLAGLLLAEGERVAGGRPPLGVAREVQARDRVLSSAGASRLVDEALTLVRASGLEFPPAYGRGEGVDVDPLRDDLIAETVRGVDGKVRGKAESLASDIVTGRIPMRTDVQVRDLAARVMAVAAPAEAAASMVAVRTAALVSQQVADGAPLAWMTQPGCCGHCAGMAGSVQDRDSGLFLPRLMIVDHPLQWAENGIEAPPLHDYCRCVLVPATTGLANALARNAVRDVALGRVGHMSAPAKARAARRLLRSRAPLTPALARKAAALAKAAGI